MDTAVRVFHLEDVADLRALVGVALSDEPAIELVGSEGNPVAGIARIVELAPDVVIMDLGLPGFDGLEAIRQVRDQLPETRVVVFSGFEPVAMEPLAREVGADRYVVKGTPLSDLRRVVLEVARQPRRAAQPPAAAPDESALAVVKRLFETPDGRTRAVMDEVLAPDVEWSAFSDGLVPRQGADTFHAHLDRLDAEGTTLETTAHSFQQIGDRVVVFGTLRTRGSAGELSDTQLYWVYHVRDGLIVRANTCLKRSDALLLAGRT
jgi:DNA-binding NarL/FixJ family response regulator